MVKNLKVLRSKRKISQQKLAEIIGVSQQSINKYENHAVEPDIHTLMVLADFFHTSVDYLVGHTDADHVIEPVFPFELNQEEIGIINNYRHLSEKEKKSIQMVMENYLAKK